MISQEQSKVHEEVAQLQQQVKTLQNMVQASSRALREIQETPSRKRTAKHYSMRHKKRIKKLRAEQCTATLSWLEDEGLTPVSVTVVNNETSELQTIWMKKDLEQALNLDGEELNEDEIDLVSMMLYVKDKYNASGSAYHEMASLCSTMPRHYRLKEKISQLNKNWNISPTPEETVGVQQSLEERLVMCVERLVSMYLGPLSLEIYELSLQPPSSPPTPPPPIYTCKFPHPEHPSILPTHVCVS